MGYLEEAANVTFPIGGHISGSTPEERFAIQMQQINELTSFYRTHHRGENVAILCGDFNIDGSDQAKFSQLKDRLHPYAKELALKYEFKRQMNDRPDFSRRIRDNGRYRLELAVPKYGIAQKHGFSLDYKPILSLL